MVVKHCCYGTCNNDNRKLNNLEKWKDMVNKFGEPVSFIPFVKPRRHLDKCKEWIKACARPKAQLSVELLDSAKGQYVYICSRHFVGERGPTDEYPNPIPLINLGSVPKQSTPKKARKPPKERELPITSFELSAMHDDTTDSSHFLDHDYTRIDYRSASNLTFEITLNEPVAESVIEPVNVAASTNEPDVVDCIVLELADMDVSGLSEHPIFSDVCVQTDGMYNIRSSFIAKITDNNEQCLYWTGIINLTILNYIHEWVLPSAKATPLWMGKKRYEARQKKGKSSKPRKRLLSHWEEYLLVLVRIRRGLDVQEIATLYDITKGHVSHVFITWVNILYKCFSGLLEYPKKEFIKENMPASFKKLFPSTRVIIDCSEIFVQVPRNVDAQKESYSSYKSHNTLKFLLGIAPSGQVTFLSKLFSGSISDPDIVHKSGFLDRIEKFDNVMADRGFNIRDMLLLLNAYLNLPAFSGGKQLSAAAVQHSRKVASVRIHVERAISSMA